MESPFVKASNTKRFVIEDSITKVTSDGEPHEMMTLIAGISGLLAAVVILTVLIFLIACKKSKNKHECDKCSESGSCTMGPVKRPCSNQSTEDDDNQSKCSSTATIYNSAKGGSGISVIYNDEENNGQRRFGNLQSNLNKAFESSELDLQNSLERPKKQKKTHWQDEMEMQRETSIQMERY